MNDKTIADKQSPSLEDLFIQARASEPRFCDDRFTARVMDNLPGIARRTVVEHGKAFNWMDVLGLGIGAVACFTLVEPAQLITWVSDTILPGKLVLSPLNLLIAGLGMGTLAFGGWWVLEGERRI